MLEKMNVLHTSAILSLVIQFITGIIEYTGLKFDVNPSDEIVKDILSVELIVQVIEFIFYAYLVYKIIFSYVSTNITSHRYFDWTITTTFMLINFIIFFKYLKEPSRKISYIDSFNENKKNILSILIANILMLLMGYLGEIGVFNVGLTTAIGFIPFAYIFKQIYSNYVSKNNTMSLFLFYFTFLIWGFYGVAAVLPFNTKNTAYNILDLFSKNAYGLFLYFYIRHLHKNKISS